MADHYEDGTCSWWHLSQPPPELVAAIGDGWLPGGGRNDIDEAVIARTFGAWRVEDMERAEVPSDTRMLGVIVARLSAPDPRFPAGGARFPDSRFPSSGPRFPAGTM
ncbi:MAG TPA: hypothetical protein VFV73_40900 [Streptosporangiaceae bacterium]|nr:hypothetical protein [Streptosporangiaceae bacterium]